MPLQRVSPDHRRPGLPRALDGRMGVARLFDAYADLLTERQRTLLHMYYHDDLSLGEIAGRVGVTRQAVFDSLRRSIAEMRHLEERLGVLAARDRAARAREVVTARLQDVEQAAGRLAQAAGVDLGPLLRALRALRESL
jgi:predicted DNA-binding protein YlxM (UPF0122 family)